MRRFACLDVCRVLPTSSARSAACADAQREEMRRSAARSRAVKSFCIWFLSGGGAALILTDRVMEIIPVSALTGNVFFWMLEQ